MHTDLKRYFELLQMFDSVDTSDVRARSLAARMQHGWVLRDALALRPSVFPPCCDRIVESTRASLPVRYLS